MPLLYLAKVPCSRSYTMQPTEYGRHPNHASGQMKHSTNMAPRVKSLK